MHWLISQFPELDHLDPDQRAQVLRNVRWRTYIMLVARALIVGAFIGVLLTSILTTWLHLDPTTSAVTFLLMAAPFVILMYLSQLKEVRTAMRREVANAFLGQKPPFCFQCGYDLRSSSTPCCPECGGVVYCPSAG